MTVQVYEDGRLIVEAKVFPFGFNNNTVSAEIRGGAQYEVRLLGPPVTMVTITSPN